MKNIFLINGAKAFSNSQAILSKNLHEHATKILKDNGFNVFTTTIDDGYDVNVEVEKFLKADIVIWQIQGWWYAAPWIVYEYIAKVFDEGADKLFTSDGRSRGDVNKKYGSGGLCKGKKYMLSWTWNAPRIAFEDKEQFYKGIGVDGISVGLHKTHEYLGFDALKTFACYDVHKNPSDFLKQYESHLYSEIINKFK